MTSHPDRRPVTGASAILARLRGRPDSEHEMSFNRVVMGIGILGYAIAIRADWPSIAVPVLYLLGAILVLVMIAKDDQVRHHRRIAVLLLDLTANSFMMIANGQSFAWFYPLLLWTILGNGFRFGVRYLAIASLISACFFATVIAATPFWRGIPEVSVGLLFGLVAIPLYTSTLIRKLSRAKKEAEEASLTKSYFLASVSHELRTPLTAIIGLGAHLQESELDEERRQATGTIVAAGRSLLSMINRLLDFSRFEAQGKAAANERFEVAGMVRGVRELLVFNAQEKGLLLGIDIEPGTPTALIGDMPHLRDVLVNLVGNAIKFTDAGSIVIGAGLRRHADGRAMLRVHVTDTGIGIAPDAQAHIFGSFRQADDTIIDRYGGTGLGLAICRQIATLLGGEIGVDSVPGKGSSFWLTALVAEIADVPAPAAMWPASDPGAAAPRLLYATTADMLPPVLRDPALDVTCVASEAALTRAVEIDPAAAVLVDAGMVHDGLELMPLGRRLGRGLAPVLVAAAPVPGIAGALFVTRLPPEGSAGDLAEAVAVSRALCDRRVPPGEPAAGEATRPRRKVLLADDNAMNQKVLTMILHRAGHEVTSVPDGEVALDRMKDHSYDLVLMDVNMPVLNGVEATKLYRFAALGQRRVPIVGVTADASPATAQRCLDAGMDACIEKPVEADILLDLVERLVDRTAAPAPQRPAFDPAGVVMALFPDPQAPAEPPAIDWSSLEELDELGGRAFVAELVDVYMADATGLLEEVRHAVGQADVVAFRSGTHAFRSSAANIGAARLAELCQHYQRISEPEFAARGRAHVLTLERELAAVATALRAREAWVRAVLL